MSGVWNTTVDNRATDHRSDADRAAALLEDLIGARGVREPIKSMLERAYQDLSKQNSKWTRRRVRAIFNYEAARIEAREMRELRAAGKRQSQLAAARKKHAEIIDTATRARRLAERRS